MELVQRVQQEVETIPEVGKSLSAATFSAKLGEADEQVEQALAKVSSLEKAKSRLGNEVEDLLLEVERANTAASGMEKKQKQFERLVAEWKHKCEGLTGELEATQVEARQSAADNLKLKVQCVESQEAAEQLSGEQKKLAEEVNDLMYQLSEASKGAHEAEKTRRKLEAEKQELQVILEEAERSLAAQEAKIVSAQLDLSNARQEIEGRLHEKEEEFENTR